MYLPSVEFTRFRGARGDGVLFAVSVFLRIVDILISEA